MSIVRTIIWIGGICSLMGSCFAYEPSLFEAERLHAATALLEHASPFAQYQAKNWLISYQPKASTEWKRYCVQHLLTHLELLVKDQNEKVHAIATQATVTNVIDGDTIKVATDTGSMTVRFLGVDTPERGEQGYTEAKQELQQLLLNKQVTLLQDSSVPTTDKYGRTLAYVYLKDNFVNLNLVEDGYARTYTVQPHLYAPLFHTAERKRVDQTPIRRRYCSEFMSCEEAKNALEEGATYLDGDNDQLPCEQDLCST